MVRWGRDQDFSFRNVILEIPKVQEEIQVGTWTNKPEIQERSLCWEKFFEGS